MDYDDLLDGLVPDLDPDDLPDLPELPAEFSLVEDGDPVREAFEDYRRAKLYSEFVYGSSFLELVTLDDEGEEFTVRLLDPTEVTISLQNDLGDAYDEDAPLRVEEGDREVEVSATFETPDRDYYGTPPVEVAEEFEREFSVPPHVHVDLRRDAGMSEVDYCRECWKVLDDPEEDCPECGSSDLWEPTAEDRRAERGKQ